MTKNKKAEEIAFSRCDVPERTNRFALKYVSEAYAGIKNCRECEFYNTCDRIDSVRAELRKKKKEGMKNMTEQETRGKIFNIIREFNVKKRRYSSHTEPSDDDELADALIAAGIGDVKEAELERKAYEVTSNQYRIWFKEQKDRAEVAEKALDLCETAYILSLNHRATEGISGQAIASDLGVHKFFIKQAEKELQEEKKDEQN